MPSSRIWPSRVSRYEQHRVRILPAGAADPRARRCRTGGTGLPCQMSGLVGGDRGGLRGPRTGIPSTRRPVAEPVLHGRTHRLAIGVKREGGCRFQRGHWQGGRTGAARWQIAAGCDAALARSVLHSRAVFRGGGKKELRRRLPADPTAAARKRSRNGIGVGVAPASLLMGRHAALRDPPHAVSLHRHRQHRGGPTLAALPRHNAA